MTIRTIACALGSAAALFAANAGAADFPDKPIRIIVPFAAGTATDQLARATSVTGSQLMHRRRPRSRL